MVEPAQSETEPEPEAEAEETTPAEEQEGDPTFTGGERTRHRLEPLEPRPRRKYGLFGPRVRPDESSSDEER